MKVIDRGICLEEALAAYNFGGDPYNAERYGEGHINDTFAVSARQQDGSTSRFIMQKINTFVFKEPDHLMQNLAGITTYLRKIIAEKGGDPDRETLTLLPTKNGDTYFIAPDGGFWRVFLFVENTVCYQKTESPEMYEAAGRAFGGFASMLEEYPAHTLHETIPFFHDTRVRFTNFKNALAKDSFGRAGKCSKEIDFVLSHQKDCAFLMDMLDAGKLPLRVTHNDTKLNNILMNPISKEAVCILDLDTVMPGLSAHDFGDSIRSGASTADEDERDLGIIHFSLPLYEVYLRGYLSSAGASMTQTEKEVLPWGAKLMTLECGMRFLTDFLEGDVYFRWDRPGHNLDRSRTQFKLVQDIEDRWDEINKLTEKYINKPF